MPREPFRGPPRDDARGRGHGVFQCGEVLWQLQGKYDKFHGDPRIWERYEKKKPADWESLQTANPRRGLSISHAGVGSHVTCAVLEKAW